MVARILRTLTVMEAFKVKKLFFEWILQGILMVSCGICSKENKMSSSDPLFYFSNKTIRFGTWINKKNQKRYTALQLVVNGTNEQNLQVMVMYQPEGSAITFVREYNEFHEKFTFHEEKYNILDIKLATKEDLEPQCSNDERCKDFLLKLSEYEVRSTSNQIDNLIKYAQQLKRELESPPSETELQKKTEIFIEKFINQIDRPIRDSLKLEYAIRYSEKVRIEFPELFIKKPELVQQKPLVRPVEEWHADSVIVLKDLSNFDIFSNGRQIERIIKKIEGLVLSLIKTELIYQDQYDILSFLSRVLNNRWHSSFSYQWEGNAIDKYAKEVKELFPELFTK